jgi:DNA-binding NarL/FixJ family response regulator
VSGLDNHEIAAQMAVSPLAMKTHAVRAMTKVEARDRKQRVTFAFGAGLYP